MLAADGRDRLAPVVLIGNTTQGWAEAVPQMPVEQFIDQAAGLQLVELLDPGPEHLHGQGFDIAFFEVVFADDLLD